MTEQLVCKCTEHSPCVAHARASQHGTYLRIKAQIEAAHRQGIDNVLAEMQWPIYANTPETVKKLSDELYKMGLGVR